jgi:hypothetical protein
MRLATPMPLIHGALRVGHDWRAGRSWRKIKPHQTDGKEDESGRYQILATRNIEIGEVLMPGPHEGVKYNDNTSRIRMVSGSL